MLQKLMRLAAKIALASPALIADAENGYASIKGAETIVEKVEDALQVVLDGLESLYPSAPIK